MPRKNSSLSKVLGGVGQLLVFNTQPTCMVISRRLGKNWQSWWGWAWRVAMKASWKRHCGWTFSWPRQMPNLEYGTCRPYMKQVRQHRLHQTQNIEPCGAGLYETRWTRSGQRHLDFNHLYHIHCAFSWKSWSQCKAKPVGFIFSHTFQLIWLKFYIRLEQFKLNILMWFLSEI